MIKKGINNISILRILMKLCTPNSMFPELHNLKYLCLLSVIPGRVGRH